MPSLQVYLILDEFIMGGEIQETSKKVPALCPECHDRICLSLQVMHA